MRNLASSFLIILCLLLAGCATQRRPVPTGTVPMQYDLSEADELFGQEVFAKLTQKFPVSQDAADQNRIQRIADKLTEAAKAGSNPWHVYVLRDDTVKNAAATRGNYIFVWSGMLRTVQSDEELAAILSHEISHVLAGHTKPTPEEEVNSALSEGMGTVAREVASNSGNIWVSMAGGLAGLLVEEAMKAFIVNPEQQRQELEADQIGLFLMADAGYNPADAVDFWERVKTDPDFSGFTLEFLSSHPASEERVTNLRNVLPGAEERYQAVAGKTRKQQFNSRVESRKKPLKPKSGWDWNNASRSEVDKASNSGGFSYSGIGSASEESGSTELHAVWEVTAPQARVYSTPNRHGSELGKLVKGITVTAPSGKIIRNDDGEWIEIANPMSGYIKVQDLSPADKG